MIVAGCRISCQSPGIRHVSGHCGMSLFFGFVILRIECRSSSLNLPIAYDERRHGAYYTEKVKQFPTVKLTTGELISLCVARQSVEAHRGTPFEAQLRSAFEKITHGMQEEINFRWDELASAFSFRASGCEVPIDLEILSALSTAVGGARGDRLRIHEAHEQKARAAPGGTAASDLLQERVISAVLRSAPGDLPHFPVEPDERSQAHGPEV